jgi:starch-binding outer membrane protein, SusD/RagB family
MKNKILIGLMVLFLIVIISSCTSTEDFLNTTPLGEYTETAVWNDPALVETFVNSMYRHAEGFPLAIVRLADFSDESHRRAAGAALAFNQSLMTPDGLLGWVGSSSRHTKDMLQWEPLYANVRRASIFFSKINSVPSDNQELINRLKGEAYFIRGLTYHWLTSLYGGVPIITKVYTLNDDFSVSRNTYEECINFIVGQLDSAAMLLPESYSDAILKGRATKGAALALKSRVLLYAASDLHFNMETYAPGYSHPELLGYIGGSRNSHWQAARDAAKAVMDLQLYDLFKKNPAPTDSVAQNIADLFTSYGNEEDIFLQYFTPTTEFGEGWGAYDPAIHSGPNGYYLYGNNNPIGELVDDYEMKDGSKFDWNNPVHKANPYANRDARLYASILYEGAQWRVRPTDLVNKDPLGKIQTGNVYDQNGNMVIGGLDTKFGPVSTWNASYTGYYTRKYIDPTIDPNYFNQDIPFRHMRYAEVLLNYAEACIELGEWTEAITYINMIRNRAGQPDLAGTLTGDDLRQAYRHERRIEYAYEDQRFWDIRRWLIGPSVYHQMHGVDIRYTTANPLTTTTYRKADGSTWSNPVFTQIEIPGDARAWNDKAYFFPFKREEMNKNNKLIQNPGYN